MKRTAAAFFLLSLALPTILLAQPEKTSDTISQESLESPHYRHIPIESLYQLLAAEMALNRMQPNVALVNYIAAAEQTQDEKVAKRATEIALSVSSLETAVKPAKLWADLAKNDLEAQITLAAIYLRLHQSKSALPILEQLATINPDLANQHYIMLFQQLPEVSEKAELIQALEKISPSSKAALAAHLALGEIYLSKGDARLALPLIQESLKQQPSSFDAIRLYAQTLVNSNKVQEAKSFLQERLKKYNTLELKSFYLQFLATYGFEAEGKAYLQSLAQDPALDEAQRLQLAKFAMESNWLDTAQPLLLQLKNSSENKDTVHYMLARLSEMEKDTPSAIRWFQQVLTGPFHVISQIRASTLMSDNHHYKEALEILERAQPQTAAEQKSIFLTEMDILSQDHQLDKALKRLNHNIKKHPSDMDYRYSRSFIASELGNIAQAEKDLKFILEQNPDHVDALNAIGYLLSNITQRYDEAYQYLSLALKLSPNNPSVLDSLGWLYYKKGDFKQSLECLQKASRILPDPEISAHLGEVLWKMKNYKEAKAVWDQGLALNPNDEEIMTTMERLMK